MKLLISKKRSSVIICALMMAVQLLTVTGCAANEHIPDSHEPIIDNDLVVDVVKDKVTFKVGQSWTLADGTDNYYFYPGTLVMYYVSGSGSFGEYGSEDNYFSYVLEFVRDHNSYSNVLVTERMTPYVTADNRNAYISRLKITESDDTMEVIHDTDLLIFPEEKYFVLFDAVHEPEETVPLDIREVVNTATFDL